MKKILVTGGGGFVGSNLVAALLRLGEQHQVVVCDNFGKSEKWRNLNKHPTYEVIPPSQLFSWMEENVSKIELVYHLGAISSTVEDDVDLLLDGNFALSTKLWEWCNAHSIRLIYASTASTYGSGDKGFEDNESLEYLQNLKSLSPHGWSKNLFYVRVANDVKLGKVKTPQWVGIKFFNVYGPNEYHKGEQHSVISKIAANAIMHGTIRLFHSYNPEYADGEQKRDVIYVKDVVRVLLWFMSKPNVSGLFNLGTGKARTFNDMAKSIFAALGHDAKIQYISMPESLAKNYQYFTEAKMDKLRAAGYDAPFTSLEDGVKDFVQNYLLKEDKYL